MTKALTVFMIFFLSTLFSQDPTFVKHTICNFQGANDVSILDIDNDGHPDIIATGYQEGVCWLKNDGHQNFTKNVISGLTENSSARSVRGKLSDGSILDFNDDGSPDLASASMRSNKITVWINNGSGQFSGVAIDSNCVGAHTVDVADIDNDGDTDVLIAAMGVSGTGSNSEFAVYYNNGNLNFEKRILSSNSNMPTFIYACDLDNDNVKEIIFVEYKTGNLGWFKLAGDNYEKIVLDSFNGMHTAMAKDYDQDGDNDILAAAYTGCKFFIWQNNGNGTFTKHWEFTGYGGAWLDIADFNKDGQYDLVAAATNNRSYGDLYWFKNNGNNTFSSTKLTSNSPEVYCSYPGDLDEDGDEDIIVALSSGNKLEWWENTLVTDIEKNPGTQKKFSLSPNYPNPFNPATRISYSLSENSHVMLEVYNPLGQKIALLVDEYQNSGNHTCTWDASKFVSGTYFYQLTVKEKNGVLYSKINKMIYLK